jgi:YfdX protein
MRLPISKNKRWTIGFGAVVTVVFAGVLVAALYATGAEAQPKKKAGDTPTSISTGSGNQFKTTVDRKTEGELSAEDFRQASLLSSRIVLHLNKAAKRLGDEQNDQARQELEKGLALVNVVRGLLPMTIVTTVVHDVDGKEVYRYVDRVQEDRIPLHENLIAVKTVEPITDAKQDEAAVQGLRLADAKLLHTSILLELDYVEGKLNRAIELVDDKPKDALALLMLAQSRGLNFVVNKEDSPLVEAQIALQLAERMVEQGREAAAKANLQLAKNHLELYIGLLAKGKSEHVAKLQREITKLQSEIGRKNAAESIRGFWDQVAGWFVQEPGEMRQTPAKAEKAELKMAEKPKK